MDKVKKDWTWMKDHMPAVVALIADERKRGNGELVNECWRRGVLNGEAGWFYAHQNGVSVGVPSADYLADPATKQIEAMFPKRALLMLKNAVVQEPEREHGA